MNGPFKPHMADGKWGVVMDGHPKRTSPYAIPDYETANAICIAMNAGYAAGFLDGSQAATKTILDVLELINSAGGQLPTSVEAVGVIRA